MSYENVGAANPSLVPAPLESQDARTILCYSWHSDISPYDFAFITIVDAAVMSAPRLRAEWRSFNFSHPGDLESAWYSFQPTYGKSCIHFFYADSSITNIEDADKVRADKMRIHGGPDEAAFEVLAGNHINISSFSGSLVPSGGHIHMQLSTAPLTKCGSFFK
jgi:hypothetical protein